MWPRSQIPFRTDVSIFVTTAVLSEAQEGWEQQFKDPEEGSGSGRVESAAGIDGYSLRLPVVPAPTPPPPLLR